MKKLEVFVVSRRVIEDGSLIDSSIMTYLTTDFDEAKKIAQQDLDRNCQFQNITMPKLEWPSPCLGESSDYSTRSDCIRFESEGYSMKIYYLIYNKILKL